VSEMAPFFHIFRLPKKFPSEYCFGGGVPVNFQMVDWMGGSEGISRDKIRDKINNFILQKQYAQASGRLLIIERSSSECWILDTGN
jgi:hypothetical protein